MGDNLTSVDLGADFDAVHLTAGYYSDGFVCALSNATLNQSAVKCWGGNGVSHSVEPTFEMQP